MSENDDKNLINTSNDDVFIDDLPIASISTIHSKKSKISCGKIMGILAVLLVIWKLWNKTLKFDINPAFRAPSVDRYEMLAKKLELEQAMLIKYYDLKQNIADGFGNDNWESMVSALSARFTHSLWTRKKIVIGGIGSSVMAGHDNCHYDSFPSQLQRQWDSVLKDANVEFEVEVLNAGIQGTCGDGFWNRLWCSNHLVGDADMVIATWNFFGMNRPDARGVTEAWIRWILQNGSVPMVLVPGTGGKKEKTMKQTQDAYKDNGFSYFHIQWFAEIHNAKTGWGDRGNGKHQTTRYGENESEARKKSLGVNNRNWHPGPLAFQFASDIIFFLCADALKVAMKNVQDGDKSFRERPIQELPEWHYDKDITGRYRGVETPFCMVGEEPAYGQSKIRVLSNEEVAEKYRGERWHQYFGNYEHKIPKAERSMAKCKHIDRCGGWRSEQKNEWFSVEVPKLSKGILSICGKIDGMEKLKAFVNDKEVKIGTRGDNTGHKNCRDVLDLPDNVKNDKFQLHLHSDSKDFKVGDVIAG